MGGSVVKVVLLDGNLAASRPEGDPPRSDTRPREAIGRPAYASGNEQPRREELAGLARLATEMERLAAWTTGITSGRAREAKPPAATNDEPGPHPSESTAAAPLAQPMSYAEPAVGPEPLRSGLFGRRFRRR